MDTTTREKMRDSLERALESESRGKEWDARDRVLWLSEQLEEYVERWIGFCELPSLPMSSLLVSDLFGAVEIGAEVLGAYLREYAATKDVQAAYGDFGAALRRVRVATRNAEAQALKEQMTVLRVALRSAV